MIRRLEHRHVRPGEPRHVTRGDARTDEDEAWLIVPDMLPVFEGPVKFIVSEELAGTMEVRFVAYQPFATGFGRAPLSVCRISGTAFKAFTL